MRGLCKTTSRSGEVPGPFDVEAQELRAPFRLLLRYIHYTKENHVIRLVSAPAATGKQATPPPRPDVGSRWKLPG
ncbi:hypothetical protein NL676_006248 [Syzygium grande]|nr:hypothetical protein NL676_006248 [Syzygium grande]